MVMRAANEKLKSRIHENALIAETNKFEDKLRYNNPQITDADLKKIVDKYSIDIALMANSNAKQKIKKMHLPDYQLDDFLIPGQKRKTLEDLVSLFL